MDLNNNNNENNKNKRRYVASAGHCRVSVCVAHSMIHVHTKFDNNRSSSFGDPLPNKNPDRRETDRQTDGNLLNAKYAHVAS